MPPKKVMKIDAGQKRLFFYSPESMSCTSTSESEAQQTPSSDLNNNTTKRIREFKQKWLSTYGWLRYVKPSNEWPDFMYCAVCEENNVKCGMSKAAQNRNFQNSTLSRHCDLPDHRRCIMVPRLQADLSTCHKKMFSEQDTAITGMVRVLEWIVQEDLPLSKFKSLVELMHAFHVKDIEILLKSKINYQSPVAAHDLLECLADYAEDTIKKKLKASEFVTVLTDESTDITNIKRQVIYAQILNEKFAPETLYITNIECKDATGAGIAQSILREMANRGVQANKIMSLGSDGATSMTGKEKGAAAILRRSNPHLHNVHCVAHRLALCTSQAAEKLPLVKKHQQILTDLFYYFKGSGKREARLHAVQTVLEDPILTIKEVHSVRWLSFFNALTAVWRTLDSLLTYLAEASPNDPKALGLKKKMATDSFLGISYMLMDSMAPLTALSQFFQTENIDVALVQIKLDNCVAELKTVAEMQSTYLLKFEEDLSDNHFKGHLIASTNFDLANLTRSFIDHVIENLQTRFPKNNILSSFGVLGLRPISFLSQPDLKEYGSQEIDILCSYYGEPQTVSWKVEGVTENATSQPVINSAETKAEWAYLKDVVLAEKYPREKLSILWQLIHTYHKDEFPNLLKLASLAITSAVHTAGCERGFSVQNKILNKSRSRLNLTTQDQLMAVKLCSVPVDYETVVKMWKNKKMRRVYELK